MLCNCARTTRARPPLFAFHSIGHRLLAGRFGHANPLPANTQTGIVHHGKHRGHPAMLRSNQPSGCPVILHHRGWRSMQAHLVL